MHLAVYFYFAINLVGKQWVDNDGRDGIDLYLPVFLIFEFLFYFGWLNVASNLYNPFGDDDEDFELIALLKRHVKVCMNIVEEDDGEIPTLEDVNFWKPMTGEILLNSQPGTEQSIGTETLKGNCLHSDCFCYV